MKRNQQSSSARSRARKHKRGSASVPTDQPYARAVILRAPKPQVYTFTRRLGELWLCAQSVPGAYGIVPQPGFSGNQFINVGSPAGDINTGTSAVYVPFASAYTLSSLNQYTDFTSLFREYRIRSVELDVGCVSHLNFNINAQFSSSPALVIAEDDTTNTPPSLPQAMAFQGAKIIPLEHAKTLKFKGAPKVSMIAYGTGLSSEFALPDSNKSMWLNTSTSGDAPHYLHCGVVRNLDASTAGNNLAISFGGVMTIDFRRPF